MTIADDMRPHLAAVGRLLNEIRQTVAADAALDPIRHPMGVTRPTRRQKRIARARAIDELAFRAQAHLNCAQDH